MKKSIRAGKSIEDLHKEKAEYISNAMQLYNYIQKELKMSPTHIKADAALSFIFSAFLFAIFIISDILWGFQIFRVLSIINNL